MAARRPFLFERSASRDPRAFVRQSLKPCISKPHVRLVSKTSCQELSKCECRCRVSMVASVSSFTRCFWASMASCIPGRGSESCCSCWSRSSTVDRNAFSLSTAAWWFCQHSAAVVGGSERPSGPASVSAPTSSPTSPASLFSAAIAAWRQRSTASPHSEAERVMTIFSCTFPSSCRRRSSSSNSPSTNTFSASCNSWSASPLSSPPTPCAP
mmetsp:Transcript_57628/g.160584  ORF Transcript_57628/g.160584 Transcript_57628/m.160584 type:complete len:212 (+) Transcript_57628:127-762(+)